MQECGRALSELDVAVQEFGEQNPLLAKQLSFSLSKLHELHVQISRLAEEKTKSLLKVSTLPKHQESFLIHKIIYLKEALSINIIYCHLGLPIARF